MFFFLCRTTRLFSPISDGEFLAACLGATVSFFVLEIKVARSYDDAVKEF